jgi:hypothetical protein
LRKVRKSNAGRRHRVSHHDKQRGQPHRQVLMTWMMTYLFNHDKPNNKNHMDGEAMSEAFERVIAEQQREIDRQKSVIDQNNKYLEKNFKQREKLKDAVFLFINAPNNYEYRNELREELRNQGWCLSCEQMPCECEE